MADAKAIPSGTVTFLFTDIEGSTRFWVEHPEEMSRIQVLHDALLKKTIEDRSGYVFKTVGDQTCAVFAEPRQAFAAAAAAQLALQKEEWSIGGQRLLVRMPYAPRYYRTIARKSSRYRWRPEPRWTWTRRSPTPWAKPVVAPTPRGRIKRGPDRPCVPW
jgi:hypothetical protein